MLCYQNKQQSAKKKKKKTHWLSTRDIDTSPRRALTYDRLGSCDDTAARSPSDSGESVLHCAESYQNSTIKQSSGIGSQLLYLVVDTGSGPYATLPSRCPRGNAQKSTNHREVRTGTAPQFYSRAPTRTVPLSVVHAFPTNDEVAMIIPHTAVQVCLRSCHQSVNGGKNSTERQRIKTKQKGKKNKKKQKHSWI